MIKCKPTRNGMQTLLMMVTFVVLAIITGTVMVLSDTLGLPPVIGQLSFIIVLMTALYYMIKYTLTEIEYELSADTLTVVKYVGKKRTVLAALDLSMTVDLVTKADFKANAGKYKISKNFKYRQNPFGEGWVYIFKFADVVASIEFEPNGIFVKNLKENIDNCKRDEQ